MKESKHNLHSTRYRSPYQSTQVASYDREPETSPRWGDIKIQQFYSASELEQILSQQRPSSHPRESVNLSHDLVCVCPGMDQKQNNMHMYAIDKRNAYLQKKIESMKEIFKKQQQRLDKLTTYSKHHSNCENNCYKDKYFELLRNVQPK